MVKTIVVSFLALTSTLAFAEDVCPDLSGIYGGMAKYGYTVSIVQEACKTVVWTFTNAKGSQEIWNWNLDGQFHIFVPSAKFAYTFDDSHIIGYGTDIQTGALDYVENVYLNGQTDLTFQEIQIIDGRVDSSKTTVLSRCAEEQTCQ